MASLVTVCSLECTSWLNWLWTIKENGISKSTKMPHSVLYIIIIPHVIITYRIAQDINAGDETNMVTKKLYQTCQNLPTQTPAIEC